MKGVVVEHKEGRDAGSEGIRKVPGASEPVEPRTVHTTTPLSHFAPTPSVADRLYKTTATDDWRGEVDTRGGPFTFIVAHGQSATSHNRRGCCPLHLRRNCDPLGSTGRNSVEPSFERKLLLST